MLEPQNIADLWNALKAVCDHLELLIAYKICTVCNETGKLQDGGSCPECLGGGKLYHVSAWRCSVCGKGPSARCYCESMLPDDE